MRLKDYDTRDGKRVWLGESELSALIAEYQTPIQRVAFLLGGRCGLRRSEIVKVRPNDFVSTPTGPVVRIWEDYAKRDKYREPPVPDDLKSIVETIGHTIDEDAPVVDVDPSTVWRWVRGAAERLEDDTEDEGWQFVDVHDLRRTWGTRLLELGVLPSVVMEWGGWDDWDTFREHYLGEFSPEAIKRERSKVDYLGGTVQFEEQRQQQNVSFIGSRFKG